MTNPSRRTGVRKQMAPNTINTGDTHLPIEAEPPFFILGCPRSGSSLLGQILNTHSRLSVYFESQFFTLFHPSLFYYGDLGQSQNIRRLIEDLLVLTRIQGIMRPPTLTEFESALVAPTFEGVLATFLKLYAYRTGKARSGDKTPQHYIYLNHLLNKFSHSPIIFTIRDPRDMALSMRTAFGTSIKMAAKIWCNALLSYTKAQENIHLVRYEDLVCKPVETLKKLCAFLDEPYESEILTFYKHTHPILGFRPHHENLLKPMNSNSVGRFQILPDADIKQIEDLCAAGMETVGYPAQISKNRKYPLVPPRVSALEMLVNNLVRYYHGPPRRWRLGLFYWRTYFRLRFGYWTRMATAGRPAEFKKPLQRG